MDLLDAMFDEVMRAPLGTDVANTTATLDPMFAEEVFLEGQFKTMMWLNDLKPLLVDGEAFIAGGVFKDMIGEHAGTPKDIDIFFYNVGGYNNAVERFRGSSKYEFLYSTNRSMGFCHKESNLTIDLVCYQFGTPFEVINRFDFTVCKMAFYKSGQVYRLVYHRQFFDDLRDRKMNTVPGRVVNADLFFNRILRYINYGFSVELSTKEELFRAAREMQPDEQISPITRTY